MSTVDQPRRTGEGGAAEIQPAGVASVEPAQSTQSASAKRSGGSRRFVLATASATCALIVLDTNVVAVSLPSIARSFHAGFADVEWVVSSYMVAFASCLLPMGAMADRYGRKKMMILGLLVFALASLGCGLAPSVSMLNTARAIKGVGASMLLTAALAVIANTFPDARDRTRAWAIWGTTMGMATTVAPLVGGVITQWIGWRWIFLLNLPVCAVLAACALRSIAESRNPDAGPVDVLGSVLFGTGLAVGIWALIGTQNEGWHSLPTVLRFTGCAAALVCFVKTEKRRPHAMVDLSLFSQPRFVAAVLSMFGYAACAQVMMTFLPLYLQNAFEWSAVWAGAGMLPFALAMICGPFVGTRLGRHQSSESVLTVGLALVGAGNLLTALVAAHRQYEWVAIGMIVTGFGAGILNGETQKAIMARVPAHRTGMASGISTTTRFTAIVTSVGVLGAVLSWRTQSVMDQHLNAAMGLGGQVDRAFMSDLLAGDIVHATSRVAPDARAALENMASASFAGGFAAALAFAGGLALIVGCLVQILSGRGRGVDGRENSRT
jgi:EmrB/QacA subfamily drug resistance transporter